MSERTEELQEQIEELSDADDIMMNIICLLYTSDAADE